MKALKMALAGIGTLSLLAMGGCKDKNVALAEEMTDKLCACKDPKCLESTMKEYEGKIDKNAKIAKEDEDRLSKKMKECMGKLMGAAMPKDEPKKEEKKAESK